MDHGMSFTGRFAFADADFLHQALLAFEQNLSNSLVTRHHLIPAGLTLYVDWEGYTTATAYEPTRSALKTLADSAESGVVACFFFGDSLQREYLTARQQPLPNNYPPAKPEVPPLNPALELPSIELLRTPPKELFSQVRGHWYGGPMVILSTPRLYRCRHCQKRTRLKPDLVRPPWPMERSIPSVFPTELRVCFDQQHPADRYRFDFYCKHCHAPVRLLFNITDTRSNELRIEIHSVIETSGAQ